jgi:hypothetical protein
MSDFHGLRYAHDGADTEGLVCGAGTKVSSMRRSVGTELIEVSGLTRFWWISEAHASGQRSDSESLIHQRRGHDVTGGGFEDSLRLRLARNVEAGGIANASLNTI